jgi:hypothetical protein
MSNCRPTMETAMGYNRHDLPYGDGTINETIDIHPPGWHGRAARVPLELQPHDPPRQWMLGHAVTVQMAEQFTQAAIKKAAKPLPVSNVGEQSYIGWFFRVHYQKLARQYGTFKIAQRMRKQGIACHVALMILTGHAATEE